MKKPATWTPPLDVVRELLDAAEYKLTEDDIVPIDTQKPQLERLRELVNGILVYLASGATEYDGIVSGEQLWATLKYAALQSKAELEARTYMRKALQREEELAKYRLGSLKSIILEMMESYGTGSEETGQRLHSPIGDLRMQRNSQEFVWVDEARIDEIPEKLGDFELVKVEKHASKTGIKAYLEDLEEQGLEKPEWAEIRPPGWHLRF